MAIHNATFDEDDCVAFEYLMGCSNENSETQTHCTMEHVTKRAMEHFRESLVAFAWLADEKC